MMPEFRRGLPRTFALALVATAGRVVVPIAVQQAIDRGLAGPAARTWAWSPSSCCSARWSSSITAVAVYRMNVRLFRTTETALAGLRVRAFRHVHDLSVLHQQGQRRGSLVSRVTSDVDQLSVFMQWGGVLGLISVGQLVVATVVMAFYSWQLTLLVLACFVPLGDRRAAGSPSAWPPPTAWSASGSATCSRAIVRVRRRRARRCAPTASGNGRRPASTPPSTGTTAPRCDAQKVTAAVFVSGEFVAAFANAAVVVVGVLLGLAGEISAGTLVAFLFLVTLFVAPVQTASEVLNEAQNAVAGFRRVLDVIDTEPDVRDPALADADRGARAARTGRSASASTRVAFRYAPDRPAGAARRRPHHRAAPAGGDRGGDRLGQDDVRQAGHPADGPGRGPGAARLGRRRLGAAGRGRLRLAAHAGGDGAAGRLPVRRDRRRQRPLRPARR